jgi:transposase
VHYRREDRIRVHVLLCWLVLLLIGIIEHETSDTWRNVRNELQRLRLGTFTAAPPAAANNAPS